MPNCTNMVCDGDVRCVSDSGYAAAIGMGCRVETSQEGIDRAMREGQEANEHRDDHSTAIGVVAGVAVAVAVVLLIAKYAKRGG